MKVLLSIKPEHAYKILEGEKRFEFRRAIFKKPEVNVVVIYATRPVGKIIGEFSIEKILSSCPKEIWRVTSRYAGISEIFFNEYFKDRDLAYAIKIKDVKRYKAPLNLKDFLPNNIAPQSFCYLPS